MLKPRQRDYVVYTTSVGFRGHMTTDQHAAAKSLQSCPTLCDPIDGSPPGSPIPGILQARTLEWVAIFILQCVKVKSESEVTQSCLTRSDPIDCSPPGSSIHGIFQARVLEWGAVAFSNMVSLNKTSSLFDSRDQLSVFLLLTGICKLHNIYHPFKVI